MADSFQKFFLNGDADKLPAIAAIGMFNEFRDLIPQGAIGDAMTRNLADRMIKLDLLDQASTLLGGLIADRLTGEARADAGARLAFVRLLDAKPAAALKALDDTDHDELNPRLRGDRARLAARALADLDRPQDALERIAADTSLDADQLRAEINTKTGNWAAAAQALGRLAGAPPPPDANLPDEQGAAVLRYAAALAMAGDQPGLDAARRLYGAQMGRGPYKGVFAVLASDAAGALPDVRDIQARLSSTAPFQSFLSAYRQRFVDQPSG